LLIYTYLVGDEVRVSDIIQLLESELDVYFLKSLAATVLGHLARKDAHVVDDILGEYLKRPLDLIVHDIFIRNFRAQVLYAHG
jgi:deoxyxylulose-5-phosphate synthase